MNFGSSPNTRTTSQRSTDIQTSSVGLKLTAVLCSGRVDIPIEISWPDAAGRRVIFEIHAVGLPLEDPVSADWFETL